MTTYWDGDGKYQEWYIEMYKKLVPPIGECDSDRGTALRVVSKLCHDLYNNSLGNLENYKTWPSVLQKIIDRYNIPLDEEMDETDQKEWAEFVEFTNDFDKYYWSWEIEEGDTKDRTKMPKKYEYPLDHPEIGKMLESMTNIVVLWCKNTDDNLARVEEMNKEYDNMRIHIEKKIDEFVGTRVKTLLENKFLMFEIGIPECIEDAKRYVKNHPEKRLWEILNAGRCFRDLISYRPIKRVLDGVYGKGQYHLTSYLIEHYCQRERVKLAHRPPIHSRIRPQTI